MKTLVLALAFFAAGCTPPYGRQTCTKPADCSDGQVCFLCNTAGDAGAGTTRGSVCNLPCTVDADCSKLGLKKPTCGSNTCGDKFCIDNPF